MTTLQWYQITEDHVILKFDFSPDVSTLINENFVLTNTDATPAEVATDPFDPIVVTRDYQSVARELVLYWNITLAADTTYSLTIQNLKTAFGTNVATGSIVFDTDGVNLATPNISETDYTKEPSDIEDWSIKTVPDGISGSSSSGGITETSEAFGILSIYPDIADSYYIGPYDYQGKIEITFNHPLPSNFINSNDFKLQRKPLTGLTTVAWENVNAVVSQNINEQVVSIYLPSTDTIPVYSYEVANIEDYIFWEQGYKYRLVISKNVGY